MYSFHNHSTFCDGKNTLEEMVLSALEKGLLSLGFSGHGYTDFDLSYCMKNTEGYLTEIRRLQEKYGNRIQIYAGVEEDSFYPIDRNQFDYIIGSSHYFCRDNQYYAIDSNPESFNKCLELFDGDVVSLAECYYTSFCNYIAYRKPDIIGHFDLITKFDELGDSIFLQNAKYNEVAEKYIKLAAENGCLFEVNTGAMARGMCTTPYPRENLLHVLKSLDANIILSADSHSAKNIDFGFDETKQYLRDIGFRHAFALIDNEFKKYTL